MAAFLLHICPAHPFPPRRTAPFVPHGFRGRLSGAHQIDGILQPAGLAQDGGQALEQHRNTRPFYAPLHDMEMEVRHPAGAAAAHQADLLPGLNRLPHRCSHAPLLQMGIQGQLAARVADEDMVAVNAGVFPMQALHPVQVGGVVRVLQPVKDLLHHTAAGGIHRPPRYHRMAEGAVKGPRIKGKLAVSAPAVGVDGGVGIRHQHSPPQGELVTVRALIGYDLHIRLCHPAPAVRLNVQAVDGLGGKARNVFMEERRPWPVPDPKNPFQAAVPVTEQLLPAVGQSGRGFLRAIADPQAYPAARKAGKRDRGGRGLPVKFQVPEEKVVVHHMLLPDHRVQHGVTFDWHFDPPLSTEAEAAPRQAVPPPVI